MTLTKNVTEFKIGELSAVKIDNVKLFDVSKVFDCGQCFRFDPVTSSNHEFEFAGCAHGRYISVAQDKDTIYIYNATARDYAEIWENYLGLDRDYEEINRDIVSLSQNQALEHRFYRLLVAFYKSVSIINAFFKRRSYKVCDLLTIILTVDKVRNAPLAN